MDRTHFSQCTSCAGASQEPFAVSAITHNIRHCGIYRRLCTACVLRTHPASFCPVCFDVYDEVTNPIPLQNRVMCLGCPSISHSSCVDPNYTYLCPTCSNPNFSFFRISQSNKKTSDGGGAVLSVDLAKQFLAAAKIASVSMNKAVEMARFDAERKAEEAILARRRAKEALERFYALKSKNDDQLIDSVKIDSAFWKNS